MFSLFRRSRYKEIPARELPGLLDQKRAAGLPVVRALGR